MSTYCLVIGSTRRNSRLRSAKRSIIAKRGWRKNRRSDEVAAAFGEEVAMLQKRKELKKKSIALTLMRDVQGSAAEKLRMFEKVRAAASGPTRTRLSKCQPK